MSIISDIRLFRITKRKKHKSIRMKITRSIQLILIAIVQFFLTNSCFANPNFSINKTGQLIKFDSIGHYNNKRIQIILDSVLDVFMVGRTTNPATFRTRLTNAHHGVSLYKLNYTSIIPEKSNKATIAYGLVAIPDSILPGTPIVSYQHGTIFDRKWAPSNPDGSIELQFQLSQFASQGYIVIAADYFGNTIGTKEQNSYGTTAGIAQACLDMLQASKQMLKKKNINPGKLFLTGWSQGGAATNSFLQKLERENIPVAGVVTASGPADMVGFIQTTINKPSPFTAPYFPAVITNMLFSFEEYYGLKGISKESIQPQFINTARKLYNFEISFEEYANAVIFANNGQSRRVRSMNEIFTKKFLDDSKLASSKFWQLLNQFTAYRQLLKSPYRSFYSYRDEAVMAEVSKIMVDYQKRIGNNNIEGFDAGANADHGTVYLESIIYAKPWFDSLR